MISGTVLALATAWLWAAANLAIRSAAQRIGSWGALIGAQIVGGAAIVAAAIVVEGSPGRLDGQAMLALAIAAAASCVGYAGLFESLRRGPVSLVTPMISSWALLSMLVAAATERALPSRVALLGGGMVIIGNALVARTTGSRPDARAETTSDAARDGTRLALGWALLAAVGFGAMVPAVNTVGARVGRLWAIPIVWMCELAIAVPVIGRLRMFGPRPRARDWPALLGAGLLEAGGFVALSIALARSSVAVVSPLASLSTTITVLFGVVWLRERPHFLALLGAAIACAGVVLVHS
jgi:drug/metabolite transporter (DMT)-like permease